MHNTQATIIANDIIQLYKQYGGSQYAGESAERPPALPLSRTNTVTATWSEVYAKLTNGENPLFESPGREFIFLTGWEGQV